MNKQFVIILLFFGLLNSLSSCTTQMPKLREKTVKSEFTYKHIRNKYFYITPVFNFTNNQVLNKSHIIMENSFKDTRNDLIFIGSNETLDIINKSSLLKEAKELARLYSDKKQIDPQKIIQLGKALKSGYIIFSGLNHFHIERYVKKGYAEVMDEKAKWSKVAETVYGAKSTLTGNLSIFSLSTGLIVFETNHETYDIVTDSEVEDENEDPVGSCIGGFLGSIFNSSNHEPTPSGAIELADIFYYEIATNLPR